MAAKKGRERIDIASDEITWRKKKQTAIAHENCGHLKTGHLSLSPLHSPCFYFLY